MAKIFYTDHDIEDLFHNGVKTLQVGDDVVLTDLAFEKALKLGVALQAGAPPAPSHLMDSAPKAKSDAPAHCSACGAATSPSPTAERGAELERRIREKVVAKLGDQVDARLLDTIIRRTLKVTGMK
ncbi:MAG: hypothetical protein HKUEN02_02070 [Anaerolineaceae bacterium]|nr:MAG: hypothetical protein B6D38_06010 [Anaerolineae bacterium UTCFX1]GJQ51360.1 MAG: hypothetical protein HKUEN02_02070 [Anaerolineaceae bacterium]